MGIRIAGMTEPVNIVWEVFVRNQQCLDIYCVQEFSSILFKQKKAMNTKKNFN